MSDQPDLDKVLEQAYQQQTERKKKLDESVDELRQVAAEGQRSSTALIRTVTGLVLLVVAAAAFVMVRDPAARPWFFVLLFCLALGGGWSYYKKTQG